MKAILFVVIIHSFILGRPAHSAQVSNDNPEIVAARKARDRASVEALQKAVARAREAAARTGSFEANLRLALFAVWLC